MVKLLKRLRGWSGTVAMFRGFDAPDVEAKERLRHLFPDLVRPATLLEGVKMHHRELGQ